MKKEEVRELLSLIRGIFGSKFFVDDSTVSAWEMYLIPFPVNIIKQAINEFIENNPKPGEPPTADVIIHLSDQIWSHQESTVPKIEYKYPKQDPKEFKKLSDESMELISLIQSGVLSHDMILAKMSEMNRKYPGIGWDDEAVKLKVFWVKQEKIPAFSFKIIANKMEVK